MHESIQPSQESTHRCVLFVIFALVILCWGFAIVGTGVYVDSGRSIMKDFVLSTDYIWKTGSCGELFRGLATARGNGPDAGQAREVCDLARDNGIPPLSLKAIIDDRIGKDTAVHAASFSKSEQARTALTEIRAELARELGSLKARYNLYRKQVAYMWLYIPALLGMAVVYYYARSHTPVLFAAGKRKFDRLLFGKNKYNEAWESFIKPKKKP